MSYETLEPPRSDGPVEAALPGGPAEPPRADPQIFVEAAPIPGASAPGWAEPVVTRTKRHRCPHWVRFADLNAKGRGRRALSVLAVWSSWAVIAFGLFAGLAGVFAAFEKGAEPVAFGGLTMACGAVLQAVSTVALAWAWRRLHRPKDFVIGLAASGFLLHLIGLGVFLTIVDSHHAVLVAAAVPYALVLWQLVAFRNMLYPRDTCRTHPGLPPAILALLKDDPVLHAASQGSPQFRVADCPHRLEFRSLRGGYRVMAVVNTVLLMGYVGSLLNLMADMLALSEFAPEREDGALAFVLVLALGNLCSLAEMHARSTRFHRAPLHIAIGAFIGYAATFAAGIWAWGDVATPALLATLALAAYWASSAAYAMKHLPPRSECASLREPPPVIQKMLRA
ncbi:hypothetical protein [Glycomyces sp. NPDC021274]|uniref:hypothetical protein n=1 Tax=Glycomyces sp. NPDC021274 TaxID=3155120 RepID=UPI0033BFC895